MLKIILKIIKGKDPISWEQIKRFQFFFVLPNKMCGVVIAVINRLWANARGEGRVLQY